MNAQNRILLVDDCALTRQAVKSILSGFDVQILEAANGDDVLSLVMHEHPSLILLDIGLPQKSGVDILDELEEEGFHIPVIVISGNKSKSLKDACNMLNVKGFLEKPLDADLLKNSVLSYLDS
jgi:CheY-like chemotaxis protein